MKIINEVISELANNEEFLKRLDDINKNEKDYEKAKSLTVKLINEYGYDLKESDITSVSPKTSRELSDDELTAVTGGVDCGCAFAGGSYGNDWFCFVELLWFYIPLGHLESCIIPLVLKVYLKETDFMNMNYISHLAF